MDVGGEIVLGVLCLGVALVIGLVPTVRHSPRVVPHRGARETLGVVFGVLFLAAAPSGHRLLAPLTAALLVCVLPLVGADLRGRRDGDRGADGR